MLDQGEYFRTFQNLVVQYRISMGSLVTYTTQRKPATNPLLNQLTEDFSKTLS